MRPIRLLSGLLAAAVLVSCGGDGGGSVIVPTPGNLDVALTGTVPADAGAILLRVTGNGTTIVDTMVAASGYSGSVRQLAGGGYEGVFIGPLAAGTVATVHVADIHKATDYAVTVIQVANGTTFAPMSIGGFPMTVSAP